MAPKVQPSMGCGYVVFAVLFAGGSGLIALAASRYQEAGKLTLSVAVPGGLGLALLAGAGGYLRLARRLVREAAAETARRAEFPGQPWKWKKEWQGPVIEAKSGATAAGLWFFAILWNAISAPGVWAFFHEAHRKPAMALVFLFPLVGAGLLWAAVYQTVRRRKYGRARFVPTALPGVIGGYLGGVIEVPARVVPEADAKLALRCVRRETRGSGKNRRTTENVLWEREEVIPRDKWVSGAGGTRIPVLFYIPPGRQNSDDSDRNNEVVWRLTAAAATTGVDFATQIEVPVFATGETATPPDASAPVLEEYQAQPLDATALAACGVRREGDTFHFSASHLPGMKLTTAVLMLGILALLGWFTTADIPGPVWAVTIIFGLIIGLFAAGVWFDRYELRVERDDVVVTKARPWGTKVTRVPRAQVKLIKTDKAMSSGENQYYRLSLVGAEGLDPGVAAADGEPFHVRKLRHQLRQAEEGGDVPSKAELLAELRTSPRFIVPFAQHVPGPGKAEAVAALVLAAVRGN